jgi:hypothetical protein
MPLPDPTPEEAVATAPDQSAPLQQISGGNRSTDPNDIAAPDETTGPDKIADQDGIIDPGPAQDPEPARPHVGSDHLGARWKNNKPSNAAYGLRAAWIASVLIVLGAVIATVHWRAPIMRVWPPSARILSIFDPAQSASEGSNSSTARR